MTRTHLMLGAALTLLTLSTTPVFAQAPAAASKVSTAQPHKSPDEKAGAMTKRMTRELTLTPDQQTKVSGLNARLAASLSELQRGDAIAKDKAAKAARRAKAQQIRTDYETGLKATLTPDQYSLYEKQRAEHKQKQQARHAARRAERGKALKNGRGIESGQPMVTPGPGPGPAQQ